MVFGGFDCGYILYKWFGIGVMVVIFLYDMIDVEMDGLGCEIVFVELVEIFGEFSFYGFLIFVVIIIVIFIFYYFWCWIY